MYLPQLIPHILRVLTHDTSKDRQVTHKMLAAIAKSKAASKVRTIDGNIKFTMEGVEGVMTVKSVFDPLSKVLGKYRPTPPLSQ